MLQTLAGALLLEQNAEWAVQRRCAGHAGGSSIHT
jgi:hypothetical protein